VVFIVRNNPILDRPHARPLKLRIIFNILDIFKLFER
jgi:hypothetical protein